METIRKMINKLVSNQRLVALINNGAKLVYNPILTNCEIDNRNNIVSAKTYSGETD